MVQAILLVLLACAAGPGAGESRDAAESLESRIPPPPGYERLALPQESFGAWLRALPLRPGRPAVRLFDGRLKKNQTAHHAVVDIDVGNEDLQQCADAVMRLRAEYLYAGACADEIRFNFTSGDEASWKAWREGWRPEITRNKVAWQQTGAPDSSYASFRRYLETVFMYAGSASLESELATVQDPSEPLSGDVLIRGGFPGHAVIVIDVAENESHERIFLLAQSYMPAQDIHVLRSFEDISPWYRARKTGNLETPEWKFQHGNMKRFGPTSCELTTRTPAKRPSAESEGP